MLQLDSKPLTNRIGMAQEQICGISCLLNKQNTCSSFVFHCAKNTNVDDFVQSDMTALNEA